MTLAHVLEHQVGLGVDEVGVVAGSAVQAVDAGTAVKDVIAAVADEGVVGGVAGQAVGAFARGRALDGHAVGDREAAPGAQRIRHPSATAFFVLQGRGAQVDGGVAVAAVADLIVAAAVPDGRVKGPRRIDVLDGVDVVARGVFLVDAVLVLKHRDVERAERADPAEVVDLGSGDPARARTALAFWRKTGAFAFVPAVVVGHDGVDLLAQAEVAVLAPDGTLDRVIARPGAAHDARAAAGVMGVRHAMAVAELMQQRGEVEAALGHAFLGPAHVAGVDLHLAGVVLAGRAHAAQQAGADARRALIGDDLDVRLGAVIDANIDDVGHGLVDVPGLLEGVHLPLLHALGDDGDIGGAARRRVVRDENVPGFGVVVGDDVLADDAVGVVGDRRAAVLDAVVRAGSVVAVGIARGAVELAAPVERVQRAVRRIERHIGRGNVGHLGDGQSVVADGVPRGPVGGVLIEGAGVDVVGACVQCCEGQHGVQTLGIRAAVRRDQQGARAAVEFEIGIRQRDQAGAARHHRHAEGVGLARFELDAEEVLVADRVDGGDDGSAADCQGRGRRPVARHRVCSDQRLGRGRNGPGRGRETVTDEGSGQLVRGAERERRNGRILAFRRLQTGQFEHGLGFSGGEGNGVLLDIDAGLETLRPGNCGHLTLLLATRRGWQPRPSKCTTTGMAVFIRTRPQPRIFGVAPATIDL